MVEVNMVEQRQIDNENYYIFTGFFNNSIKIQKLKFISEKTCSKYYEFKTQSQNMQKL